MFIIHLTTLLSYVNKFLVPKETMELRLWESEKKIGFIKRVDKGRITAMKDLESCHFERYRFVRANDVGLTLETSAFQMSCGGISTFINSFDEAKFLLLLT